MSPCCGKAEGPGRNAPADRTAEVERLATVCLNLSHFLRDLRDRHAGLLAPDDFDFLTELGVELAAYGAVLQMNVERQIDWLTHTIELADRTLRRVRDEQGGAP